MWTPEKVRRQLKKLGFRVRWWGRGEIGELPRILEKGEQIIGIVYGTYEAGFAIMLLTDHRLLFVDKSFFHCRFDEVMLDVVGSVEYRTGMLSGRLFITYRGGELHLRGVPNQRLRHFATLLETKIEPKVSGS